MHQWKGENKLCIPGMQKIPPGGIFELEGELSNNAGVKALIKQGLIVEVQKATPEPAEPATSEPVSTAAPTSNEAERTPELPQESQESQEPQRPGKDRVRRK